MLRDRNSLDIETMSAAVIGDNIGNLEDLVVVWLDETINNDSLIWSKRQSRLQNRISFIRTFVDQNECIEYISNVCNEHIFLIVSGSIGEIVLPKIHDRIQVREIYIFCCDVIKHTQWSKSYSKISGVFNDENPLMMCLEKDVQMYSNSLLPLNIAKSNQRSLQDIDNEQVTFIWFQLMTEVLSRLPQNARAKEEMIDECRRQYADNLTQLSTIEDFHHKYDGNCAISWYTKDCFLYRLLNKAFRTENIDIIFNYHYFLSDLTKELTKLHLSQYSGKQGILTVYRGQHIHITELEKIKNSVGHLVSINTFFSASTSSSVAADFSGSGEYRSQSIESIIFEINVDLSVQRRPFANIRQASQNKDENEMLFAIGSIFRIESVDLFLDDIWLCVLTLTSEVKKEIEDLLAYFTKHIGTQPSILELGVLLSKSGDFERAKRFYFRLKNELPKGHTDLGVLYNNLGEIYRQQGHLDTAMHYYILAIDELIVTHSFVHPWLAIVHSNIAMIFDARHQLDNALTSYLCALLIIESQDVNHESELCSTIYNGIATIYQQKGQLDQALELYKKTLQIEVNILPSNHPSIAMTLNNIGQLYFEMEKISESHEYISQALSVFLSTLPDNHQHLAVVYSTLGAIYFHENELHRAVEYLLKVEEIIDRSPLIVDNSFREYIYCRLATASGTNKMFDLSIRMHHKVINFYKLQKSSDQYEIAYWTSILANLLFNQNNHQEAFQYQQDSLRIIEKLPRTNRNKELYCKIIDSLWCYEYYDIAIEHYKRLLCEETDLLSILSGKINNNLAVIYDHMENDHLALKHYIAALDCYESHVSSAFTKETAIIQYNIAGILSNLHEYEAARDYLKRSLNHLTDFDCDIRAQCYYLLGETYEKTEDWACAQQHWYEARELSMKANMHKNFVEKCNRHLIQALKNLERTASIDSEL